MTMIVSRETTLPRPDAPSGEPTRGPRRRGRRFLALVVTALAAGALFIPGASADDDDLNLAAGQNTSCASITPPFAPGSALNSAKASQALFTSSLLGLAADRTGKKVYIADGARNMIHLVDPAQDSIKTVAGSGKDADPPDATNPLQASMKGIRAIASAPGNDDVFVLSTAASPPALTLRRFRDGGTNQVVVANLPSTATTTPSSSTSSSSSSSSTSSSTSTNPTTSTTLGSTPSPPAPPLGLAVDGQGNAYVAEGTKVRKIAPGGQVTDVGVQGLNKAESVAVEVAGQTLYVSDTSPSGGSRVLRVDAVTGTSTPVVTDLEGPSAVAVDSAGDHLYIAAYPKGTTAGGQIKRVFKPKGPSPVIDVVVNQPGARGTGGNGADAVKAQLIGPSAVATDLPGRTLYVLDKDACAVRWVLAVPEPTSTVDTTTVSTAPPTTAPTNTEGQNPSGGAGTGGEGQQSGDTAGDGTGTSTGFEDGGLPESDPDSAFGTDDGEMAGMDDEFDLSEFYFGGAGTKFQGGGFNFNFGDFGNFGNMFGPQSGMVPDADGSMFDALGAGDPESDVLAAMGSGTPPEPDPAVLAQSVLPPAAPSPGSSPGIAASGSSPPPAAARYAMVARDASGTSMMLAAAGVLVASGGCVVLVFAGRPRRAASRRYRPCPGRVY